MNINRNNYEEFFLLYIDRELDDAGRQTVETFVRQHPDLEKELAALKQTVVLPPVMEFENKNQLFRNEKPRRLAPVFWWRVAAALVIILTGAWFLFMSGKAGRRDGADAGEGKLAIQPAGVQQKTVQEQKTRDTGNALSGTKDVPAAPVRRAGNTVAAATPNPPAELSAPASNPVTRKLNPVEQNGREAMVKTVPEPENNDQPIAASDNKDPKPAVDLPVIAANNSLPETTDWSSIRPGKASVQLPSVIGHPSPNDQQPASTQSILVFNNKNKTVSGFFKKFKTGSPEGATAENNRQKITVSVFQFNLKK